MQGSATSLGEFQGPLAEDGRAGGQHLGAVGRYTQGWCVAWDSHESYSKLKARCLQFPVEPFPLPDSRGLPTKPGSVPAVTKAVR